MKLNSRIIINLTIMKKDVAILFVDDEYASLATYKREINAVAPDWKLYFTQAGEDALRALLIKKVDVIVADLKMPHMNGTELLKQVKEKHPNLVRVLVSESREKLRVIRSSNLAHRFLAKPCKGEDLKNNILNAMTLNDMIDNKQLIELINGIGELPSVPETYLDIEKLLEDEKTTVDTLSDFISNDPSLTAKILQTVNSGFFGLPRTITELNTAIGLLGTHIIKSLVLYLHTFALQGATGEQRQHIQKLSQHSLKVAHLAKNLCQKEKLEKVITNDAFTAGILHDIGLLVLMKVPGFIHLRKELLSKGATEQDAELEAAGVTHEAAGAYLLGLWGIPQHIVETAAFHHNTSLITQEGFTMLFAVHLANAFEGLNGKEFKIDTLKANLAYIKANGMEEKVPEWYNIYRDTLLSN